MDTVTGVALSATITWDELASAALLGAQRGMRTGSLPPAELLDAAALLAVARRAGNRPRRMAPQDLERESGLTDSSLTAESGSATSGLDLDDQDQRDPATATTATTPTRPRLTRPDPMPADPRPLISPAASSRLRAILDGHQKYLPEWLAAARASGARIPPVFFPELLDLTRNNVLIRADVAALLGEPGRWLAALNRGWAFFLDRPGDQPAGRPDPTSRSNRPVSAPVADFTAEARRLLARPKNSNDLYNLVMRQPGLWPEEGARLLIEYVAAHRYPATGSGLRIDGGLPIGRSSDWAIEQLQRTIGDHAPLRLRGLVRELIEQPVGPGTDPANPVVDLREILDALAFRADMHEELTEPGTRRRQPAPSEGRPH
jgi:hypothetical protein